MVLTKFWFKGFFVVTFVSIFEVLFFFYNFGNQKTAQKSSQLIQKVVESDKFTFTVSDTS